MPRFNFLAEVLFNCHTHSARPLSGVLQLKKVGKWNQSSVRNSDALMQRGERGGHGKARLWDRGGQSWTGFTSKLIAVGSSQAFARGLLASLPILPKPGRGG